VDIRRALNASIRRSSSRQDSCSSSSIVKTENDSTCGLQSIDGWFQWPQFILQVFKLELDEACTFI